MRLNAYVLGGDPAWAGQSLRSYYPFVNRVIVSYDADSLSWSGAPLDTADAVAALRASDPDGKVVLAPGKYSRPGEPALASETMQRQAALDQASEGSDWVIQLDSDEILLAPATFRHHLGEASHRGAEGMEYPLRDFHQQIGPGRFLERSNRFWRPRANYPAPVAVRAGTRLVHARQADAALYRVDLSWRNTDPYHPWQVEVHAVVSHSEAIAHMSWVRTRAEMDSKAITSGHAGNAEWRKGLERWESRGRNPWPAVLATPFRSGHAARFRVTRLGFDRES